MLPRERVEDLAAARGVFCAARRAQRDSVKPATMNDRLGFTRRRSRPSLELGLDVQRRTPYITSKLWN
jgi:hypothetical protein